MKSTNYAGRSQNRIIKAKRTAVVTKKCVLYLAEALQYNSCKGGVIIIRDAEKTIGNLIDKQGVAFISSVAADGFPNTKAMLPPRKRDGIKTFYFTTNTSSMRVSQYRQNPKACIYFCDRRFFRGVMLIGTVEVLEDSESKEMIWRTGDTMYYPKGVTDPDYCVLRFTAARGRFYSNFKSESFDI